MRIIHSIFHMWKSRDRRLAVTGRPPWRPANQSLIVHHVISAYEKRCGWSDLYAKILFALGRIVMVLGAGRGPLVTAALKAAEKADRIINVYAVEKNPNAVNT